MLEHALHAPEATACDHHGLGAIGYRNIGGRGWDDDSVFGGA
jgi:hypothetical protein